VDRVRDAGDGIVRPAVALGEFDRLHAARGPQRYGVEDGDLRQVREGAQLEEGSVDSPRKRKGVPEVSLCRLEAACPELGHPELEQRQGAEVIAEP
jgi:hypothetical protein